jgi:hypothetical protein
MICVKNINKILYIHRKKKIIVVNQMLYFSFDILHDDKGIFYISKSDKYINFNYYSNLVYELQQMIYMKKIKKLY